MTASALLRRPAAWAGGGNTRNVPEDKKHAADDQRMDVRVEGDEVAECLQAPACAPLLKHSQHSVMPLSRSTLVASPCPVGRQIFRGVAVGFGSLARRFLGYTPRGIRRRRLVVAEILSLHVVHRTRPVLWSLGKLDVHAPPAVEAEFLEIAIEMLQLDQPLNIVEGNYLK